MELFPRIANGTLFPRVKSGKLVIRFVHLGPDYVELHFPPLTVGWIRKSK